MKDLGGALSTPTRATPRKTRLASSRRLRACVSAAAIGLLALPAAAEIVLIGGGQAADSERVFLRPTPQTYGSFTATNPGAYNPDVNNKLSFIGRVYTALDMFNGDHGSNVGFHDYSSSFGFRGALRLRDDFAVVWQAEHTLDNYDATGTLASRETFIGVTQKNLGSLRVGRFQNPYDRHSVFGDMVADTQGMGITQVLWANCGVAPAFKGFTPANACFDNKQPNSVRFDSIDYGPFFGAIQYSGYNQGLSTSNSLAGGPNSVSTQLTYRSFPFIASVGWEHHTRMTTINKLTTTKGVTTAALNPGTIAGIAGNDNAYELVAGYQITPNAYVGGIVERLEYDTDLFGSKVNRNMLGLVGRYTIGPQWLLETTYQKAGEGKGSAAPGVCAGNVCAGPKTGATHITLGARYNIVPQTAVYVQFVRIANEANGIYSLKNYAVQSPGEKANGLSLGFQHVF